MSAVLLAAALAGGMVGYRWDDLGPDHYELTVEQSRTVGPVVVRFSGALGVYDAASTPVIPKRLHPRIEYDLAGVTWSLGHESNGQTVDERREFDALSPLAALQVSRAWDYVGVRAGPLALRYFILPGRREEARRWEAPSVRNRADVDGIRLQASRWGSTLTYTTGYTAPGKYNTFRWETACSRGLVVWGQWGYNADLINYGRKTASYGVGVTYD